MKKESKWAEIKCDYLCEEPDDMFWRVDAWKTDNDEGKVIAYIDDLTGRVVYADPDARFDEYAQAVIKDRLKDLSENFLWTIASCGSENDIITVERRVGTKEEIREYLLEMAASEKEEAEMEGYAHYEYGPEDAGDIEETDGVLYACNCFSDSHTVYTARPDRKDGAVYSG